MKLGREFRGLGQSMTIGIQMVVVTAAITAIGYWLDKKIGRETPLFLIVFFVLGALGGLAVVWRGLYRDKNGAD